MSVNRVNTFDYLNNIMILIKGYAYGVQGIDNSPNLIEAQHMLAYFKNVLDLAKLHYPGNNDFTNLDNDYTKVSNDINLVNLVGLEIARYKTATGAQKQVLAKKINNYIKNLNPVYKKQFSQIKTIPSEIGVQSIRNLYRQQPQGVAQQQKKQVVSQPDTIQSIRNLFRFPKKPLVVAQQQKPQQAPVVAKKQTPVIIKQQTPVIIKQQVVAKQQTPVIIKQQTPVIIKQQKAPVVEQKTTLIAPTLVSPQGSKQQTQKLLSQWANNELNLNKKLLQSPTQQNVDKSLKRMGYNKRIIQSFLQGDVGTLKTIPQTQIDKQKLTQIYKSLQNKRDDQAIKTTLKQIIQKFNKTIDQTSFSPHNVSFDSSQKTQQQGGVKLISDWINSELNRQKQQPPPFTKQDVDQNVNRINYNIDIINSILKDEDRNIQSLNKYPQTQINKQKITQIYKKLGNNKIDVETTTKLNQALATLTSKRNNYLQIKNQIQNKQLQKFVAPSV